MPYEIEYRNPFGEKDPLFTLKHVSPEHAGKQSLPTLEAARDYIQARIQQKIDRLQRELANALHNLANIGALYVAPQPLEDLLKDQYAELCAGFESLKNCQGSFVIGPLTIRNNYLDVGAHLHVFDLPQWDPVVYTFTPAAIAVLDRAMAEVGLDKRQEWNGAGYHSRSVIAYWNTLLKEAA